MAMTYKTQHPPRPALEGADSGFVRFDPSMMMFEDLPPLKPQAQEMTDRGIVRLGATTITSVR